MSNQADTEDIEPVEEFRTRARTWIRENLAPLQPGQAGRSHYPSDEAELAEMTRQRGLQRQLFDAGFTGFVVDKAYGGQGLTAAHSTAFSQEIAGYDHPWMLQVPNMSPCLAIINEFGTHEQKLRHIPPLLRGENVWIQFLSEPASGSDAAGAQTTAVRDGDEWLLNGSKVWSSGAWRADWGLCLARTNSEVPKHRGLSVFLVPTHAPGIEMHRIEMLDGNREFCQEFFTDVRVPHADLVGEPDQGWTVGTRWMFHERSFAISPYVIRAGLYGGGVDSDVLLVRRARESGRIDDALVRDMIGEVRANSIVGSVTTRRINDGIRTRYFSDQGASLVKLLGCIHGVRHSTVAFELTGGAGVAWEDADQELGDLGVDFLQRQRSQIAGGTVEMARNVVAERVLGMPRERDASKELAFREVPKGPPARVN